MPIIDMPLEELYRFEGRNERPADMEEYWNRAIAEMEALGTDCELIPAEFQIPGADCFEMYFTGVGGARIHGRLARPKKQEGVKRPAVCLFHGYSGAGGSFSGLLRWVAAGFVAANLDCRGQAGLSEDIVPVRGNTLHGQIIRGLIDPDPDKLYFRNVFLDTAQLARIVMAMDDVDATIRRYNAQLLKDAGVLADVSEIGKLMWHGGSHHIGYDVHDVVKRPQIIGPNMVFCVDIGVYHEEWGIGFRLEDNCLITENGCENLSAAIPRTIEDIEAVMRGA